MPSSDKWKQSAVNQKHYLTYNGDIPEYLYRYRSLTPKTIDRVVNTEIIEEVVYLPSMQQLNDPDEGRFQISFPHDKRKLLNFWRKAIKKTHPEASEHLVNNEARELTQRVIELNYVPPRHVAEHTRYVIGNVIRVACFTTQPTNFSMWANYAKLTTESGDTLGHAGVCIQYQCDDSWKSRGLHPVAYTDDVPVVDPTKQDEESFAKVMYTKSREWRGEAEWRISSVLKVLPPFPENLHTNCKVRIKNSVTAVIYGMNTPGYLQDQISERLQKAGAHAKQYKVVRNPDTFVRQLDLLK